MKYFITLIVVAIMVIATKINGQNNAKRCQKESDCPNGCCVSDGLNLLCEPLSSNGSTCIPGNEPENGVYALICPCEKGLICKDILFQNYECQ